MTTDTRNPTASSGGWTNASNAYTDDTNYATLATRNVSGFWTTYGYTDPGGATIITGVSLALKGYQATGGDDKLQPAYTTDNSTYTNAGGQIQLPAGSASESITWVDITSLETSWTWTMLNNTNFKVRLVSARTGGTFSTQSLNWIPTSVTYTTAVTSSFGIILTA